MRNNIKSNKNLYTDIINSYQSAMDKHMIKTTIKDISVSVICFPP